MTIDRDKLREDAANEWANGKYCHPMAQRVGKMDFLPGFDRAHQPDALETVPEIKSLLSIVRYIETACSITIDDFDKLSNIDFRDFDVEELKDLIDMSKAALTNFYKRGSK